MPGRTETALYESGRATAPPGVRYTSLTGSTNEGYTHTVAATSSSNLAEQLRTTPIQSPRYTPSYTNYVQQRPQASPRCTPNYSPCPSPSPNYPVAIPKPTPSPSSLPSQSPQYTPNYNSSPHLYSSSFGSSGSNFPTFNSSNFDLPSTSTSPNKSQQSYGTHDNTAFPSSDHLSSALFNIPKTSKTNLSTSPRYASNHSNFSYFSNNQPKFGQNKVEDYVDKSPKSKNDFQVPQKLPKSCKDDAEFNYNIGDLQQFLSKHGSKIKHSSETVQDSVTDSLLNFLQRKTFEKSVHDNFPYDTSDANQVVVSVCNKNKSEEDLKKKETAEDSKLMNEFLSKVISDKEEKRFKNLEDKKKNLRKEILDELGGDAEDKKIKRDAMSHYQEDKTQHKRAANYGDFSQWDYLNPQEMQTGNNHNRRGHMPFGTSQAHSMAWNPMGMGLPHQTNPYYPNPHGHVMPAHAHTEYRYNQWNNPNHKNVTNIQNAHSQNSSLPQSKLDMKHHGSSQNKTNPQDFGIPIAPPTEYSKLRSSPHDMIHRTPPPDLTHRSTHPDYPPSISPALRNPPPLRTPPPLPGHPKTIISNPLSDLQMLVANQETEDPPMKVENYQQESVDLSAHSETSKHKENNVPEKAVNNSTDKAIEIDKPVELTAKISERSESASEGKSEQSAEKEISSTNDANAKEMEKAPQPSVCEKIEECSKSVTVDRDEENKEKQEKATEEAKEIPKEESTEKPEEVDDEIARQLASLDGPDNKTDVNSTTPKKEDKLPEDESDDSNVSKVKFRRKSANEVPASSSNDDTAKNPQKRKAPSEKPETDSKKVYIEVENELEKMFEGVEGEENSDLPTVSSTSTDVKPATNESSKKTPRKRPSRNARSARLSSGQSSSSENPVHKKKSKSHGGKEESRKKAKKNLCEMMDSSRRGPVLHVEGTRECPTSVVVINFPKGDDEDEKDKSVAKKQAVSGSRISHHNELDYRGRSRNGLFSSTLSARYDAHTTDQTWICVFCKKGPHYSTLGDLFGPYIISQDEETTLCDFSGDEKDISDAQKRGGRNKRSIRSNNMVEHFQKMSRKLRRLQSTESCLTGMTLVCDDQVDQLRYEVWVHEQCAIWSPNVCLIGSRIVGMQEAIWSSVKTMCSKCGQMGANLGCVHRSCPNRSHYSCAKETGWSLEQETFISTCHIHKPRS